MAVKQKGLTKKQLNELKDMLMAEKERIHNSISVKKAGGFNVAAAETKDSVDEANENILISQKARFTNRENLFLKKIHKSLIKIEEGKYGFCEECASPISFTRLKARLTSDLCIICKEESENEERHSIFGKKSKSLGKTLSLSR